nr:hypothetical protein GCM10020185_47240 [Pseudomonas brassicacearum subsp. brassicacearum]
MGDGVYTLVTYYFLPTAWRAEVFFKGMSLTLVNRELIERGILEPSAEGRAAQSVRLPGLSKTRAYVVHASALLASEAEAA